MSFKKLAEKGVGFTKEHVLNKQRLEQEILPRHPEHKDLILQHVNSMKMSMRISTLCMLVLTICGAVLMYYRR